MPALGKSNDVFKQAEDLRQMARDGAITPEQLAYGLKTLERSNSDSRIGYYLGPADMELSNIIIYDLVPPDTIGMVNTISGESVWLKNMDISRYQSSVDYQRQVLGEWSDEEVNVMNRIISDEFKRIAEEQEREILRSYYAASYYGAWPKVSSSSNEITGPADVNAAERVWREHDGVVLCECDNPDCDTVVAIAHDQYVLASGRNKGWYRVTSPECGYGVVGAKLVQRTTHYLSWTKIE